MRKIDEFQEFTTIILTFQAKGISQNIIESIIRKYIITTGDYLRVFLKAEFIYEKI